MQGYLYSIFSALAIVVHLTINAKALAGHGEQTQRGKSYRGFLLGVLAYYVADAAWGVFAGLQCIPAWYACSIFFFLSLVVFATTWCRFATIYLRFGKWSARTLMWCGYALLAFNIVALAANFFDGCVFYFDEEGTYCVGPLRDPLFHLLIVFSALMSGSVLVKALSSHGPVRGRDMIVFMFGLTTTVAITLQVIWPLTPFTSLGCLIGNCFIHVFIVEDERKEKHTKELEDALARARAAEKTRSIFFSIVSHDIRTPLNAILGYAELLERGIESKAERTEALKSIHASGTTLLQLVNDVLDLSKMDAGKMVLQPTPVNLNRLTADVFSSFRLAAQEKHVTLENKTADVPTLMLDGHRFRQILFNLVGNAMKYTSCGRVTVAASYVGDTLTLSVADTGCGIEPAMLKRVLEPFVQVLDPSHTGVRNSGTGLGLAICKRIVEVMGGQLTVESEPWKGSVFKATIPGVAAKKVKAADDDGDWSANFAEPKKPPKHVLVVDDSPVNRSVLKAFLAKAGVQEVDFACDGAEALKSLKARVREGKPHDFVFTDYWMPNMNGMELVEKVRAESEFDGLPVFAVTADTECGNDERTKLFTGILLKPLTYGKLMDAFAVFDHA